jgi:hypothetical protein
MGVGSSSRPTDGYLILIPNVNLKRLHDVRPAEQIRILVNVD